MGMTLKLAVSQSSRGRSAGACAVATTLALGLLSPTAQARDFFSFGGGGYYPRSYYYSGRSLDGYRDGYDGGPKVDRLKAQTAEKLKKAPVPPPTKGPLMVVVSISKQRLTVYDQGVPFLHSKVSTGSRGHETPTGVFAVIQKSRWHRSNLYSDAPMPFMQRITWSGVALHAGQLPGYPASHGCIRLPEDFAIRMWRTTQMGARVIVTQGDVAPADISHPVLFVKKAAPAAVPPMASNAVVPPVSGAEAAKVAGDKSEVQVKVAEVSIVRAGQAADAMAMAGSSASVTSTSTVSASREMPISREAPLSTLPQSTSPSTLAQAAEPAPAAAPSPAAPPTAPSAAPERTLRPGPVSVFVSRKERKLFVRKGFEPLFDAPVTIKDADQPLGTHVFTALAQNADDTMRWNVVTVPNGQAKADRRAETPVHLAARKRPAAEETMTDALPPPSTAAAKAALDRIEMPADAVERISALMSVGASLIVSDEGLGPETGQETDFVVLTRDGPQPPPATKKPRRRNADYD